MRRFIFIYLLASLYGAVAQPIYQHFEGRQTHPLALTPDGTRLLALNTPEARLCVYDVSNAANPAPVLLAEIPVGLEPVSVAARTNDEVWVVNEVSDSISIVSLSRRLVTTTLAAPDEPADVVFAQGKGYVSCARNHLIRVIDTTSHAELTSIPLAGDSPRALVVNAAGTRLYAAFQLSGNHTTVLPASPARAQSNPTNPALPAPPKTGLIVDASDARVFYTVLDHDVAEVDLGTHEVLTYHSGVGTNLFDLALRPGSDELWVTNTDARNRTLFEPNLRGHFVENQVTRCALGSGNVTPFNLNADLDYALLPNPAAVATALAQPSSIVFEADGVTAWVAAFGSDRIAQISATDGRVLARVELRLGSASAANLRGPRGLVRHPAQDRLFVLNKLSNTITTIATSTQTILSELPVGSYDLIPPAIKAGRGILFDARLSGNGTMSCATCHLDADRDGLAWDLGDPGGDMLTLIGYNNSIHDARPKNRVLHPMKGPMTTQTLRGFLPGQSFHWRGDKPTVQSFNTTFTKLMGGAPIPPADMDALAAYLAALVLHPNPHQNLDRSLPTTLAGGNPNNGRDLFLNHNRGHCSACHTSPTGTDQNIDLFTLVGSFQPVKTPHLRTVYQRANFDGTAGTVNVSGFGLLKDGTGYDLPIAHFYDLETLYDVQDYTDIKAYVLAFDTGTAPAVGRSLTVHEGEALPSELPVLEAQASIANCDLVARGRVAGRFGNYLFNQTTLRYRSDQPGDGELSRTDLLSQLGSGDALTFLSVLPGHGARFAGDRNADGVLDTSGPWPALTLQPQGQMLRLRWPSADLGWTLEASADLGSPWAPVTAPRLPLPDELQLEITPTSVAHFYRLHRTW